MARWDDLSKAGRHMGEQDTGGEHGQQTESKVGPAAGKAKRELNYHAPLRPGEAGGRSSVRQFLLGGGVGVLAIAVPTACIGMTHGADGALVVGLLLHGLMFLGGLACMIDARYRPTGLGILMASLVLPTILMSACFVRF